MAQTVLVREGNSGDIPLIIGFQKAMALETEALHLEENILQKGVEAVFADANKGRYFVAALDGKVIASLMTTYEWSDWRNGWIWWIQSVYVIPSARGKGIYKRMYNFLQEKLKESPDVRGIRLYVDKSNRSANAVYEKLGMNGEHYSLFEWMPE